jgi:hypothetical protein
MKRQNAKRFAVVTAALAFGTGAAMMPGSPAWTAESSAGPLQKQKDKKPAAAPGVFVEEHGTFQVAVDGQPAGTEVFEIQPGAGEWTARGTAEVPGENGTTSKVTGKMELSPDGAPLKYEWSATSPRKASATVVFEGTKATMELKVEGATNPFTQDFTFQAPPVVILDNNLYHHYAVLARIYDWEHKEPKTYAVLIPQDLTPGTITVDYAGAQVLNGQKVDLLRVHSADLEIDLFCETGEHRLIQIEVPAAKAVITRQTSKK